MELTWEGWVTLSVIAAVFLTLARNVAPPDVVMLSACVFLGVTGVLDSGEVFAGFTNPGVLTIGALFVVAAGVRETGALDELSRHLLGRARTERAALVRMAASVIPMSAFLNNTPVVAMLVPVFTNWCRKQQVSPSRLLIPLSYMAILGGTCTLIGTSTTIVVNGLIQEERAKYTADAETLPQDPETQAFRQSMAASLRPLGMFEVSAVGVPFALLGALYLLTAGRRLLPDRKDLLDSHGESARSYLADMRVQPGCHLAGQTVEAAGLRHLPGLFLVEVVRGEHAITPVRPDEVLHENDILTFTGVLDTIVDLERIPGLVPVADAGYEEQAVQRREKSLCEAVISATSPLIGKNVRDADFRAVYNAAIVAVHRGGQRLRGRVGDIVLEHGDTLLLQAGPHFLRAHRNNRDFYLVSGVEESRSLRHDKMAIAGGLLVGLVLLLCFGSQVGTAIPVAATGVAVLMIATRCISPAVARASIDWRTLLTIAGAIALGRAMDKTGTAAELASFLVSGTRAWGPYAVLAILYVATSALTECVTTKGAAILMFQIAMATAVAMGTSPRPFAMAVLFASAASLVTPLGYQTNLMVYGPGGYRFSDYMRIGLPLNLILTLTAILLIPRVWPF